MLTAYFSTCWACSCCCFATALPCSLVSCRRRTSESCTPLNRLSTPAAVSYGHKLPTSAASSCKSCVMLCPCTSARQGSAGPKPLPTLLAPQPLERHFHPSETRQQDAPFRSSRSHLLAAARRTPRRLLFVLADRLCERFFHRFSSCFLYLVFHLRETGGCIQFDLERYCHVHKRFLPVFFSFCHTVATSL